MSFKLMADLGRKIDECRQKLFDEGWSYKDANDMVKLVFEEKESYEEKIKHLDNTFNK